MHASPEKAVIAIDVGGTNLRFALVDSKGRIVTRDRQPTSIRLGREPFLERLDAGIAALKREAVSHGLHVSAVGVGIPGLITRDGSVHSSVNLTPLEGANLREQISSRSALPTVVVNDANAAAFGEKMHGAGAPYDSFLLLTLGTGVGSGLLLDGKLWTGIDGFAGEYGHATVEPDGRPCPCGNRGCLEQYASATALVSAAIRARQKGGDGGEFTREMTAESLAHAARAGDPLTTSLFAEAGRYIGMAAATAANLLNLEALIIGGGMAASFDLLVGAIRTEIDARAFPPMAGRLSVVRGELGDDAGILGAAAMALKLVNGE